MNREKPKKFNLTKKALEKLEPNPNKRIVIHDTSTKGLCVRVEPSGRKTFCWFRKVNGRPEFKYIGAFPDLSIENARGKASEINASFSTWKANEYQGDNPFERRRRDLTFDNVLEDYIERHLRATAKNPDRACAGARWQFTKYVNKWRNRMIGAIRKKDVLDLHKDLAKENGTFTANRTVQLLRALYNWAIDHMEWKGENAAARIKLFFERKRDRFLRGEEIARLFTALREEPSQDLQDFVIMSLFTGARSGDVLSSRWENISFDPPVWKIPNPKNREPYDVALVTEVVEILKARKQSAKKGVSWVFPGRGRTGHVTGFKRSWKELLKRAALTDMRIHDMRRTLGSWQAAAGVSLQIIGKSLGHRSTAATEIYARMNLDPVRDAVQSATRAMIAATEQKPAPKKEVKRLKGARRG